MTREVVAQKWMHQEMYEQQGRRAQRRIKDTAHRCAIKQIRAARIEQLVEDACDAVSEDHD